jgi:hypothetical protein
MIDLASALEFANYQATLSQQKRLIKQKFDDQCVVAVNGGLFKITPEFIAGVSHIKSSWVIDTNGNPINVGPLSTFVENCTKTYTDAVSEYGDAYEQIKKQRSVSTLVGI